MSDLTTSQRLIILAIVWLLLSGGGGVGPSNSKPLVVMLHESLHGNLPPYALGAAHDLEADGYEVRPVDDDLTDGTGEIPPWLKPALEPGRKIMGGNTDGEQKDDALILLNGQRVVKAIKLPSTREAIVGAVK